MSNKTDRFVSFSVAAALAALTSWAAAQAPAASDPAAQLPPAPAAIVAPPPVDPNPVSAPSWAELSADQRQMLAPLERDWNSLDEPRRRIWLEMAPGFARLPAEERDRLHERMRAWVALSPAERQRARVNFQLAKQSLHASEREARWEAYQALPPEKRQELAEKAVARRRQLQTAKPPCLPTAPGANCATTALKAQPKSNRVPELKRPQVKSITPSLIQAKPGVTTVLINEERLRPALAPGLTKVVADPNLVDPYTLLPRRQPVVPAAVPAAPAASTPR